MIAASFKSSKPKMSDMNIEPGSPEVKLHFNDAESSESEDCNESFNRYQFLFNQLEQFKHFIKEEHDPKKKLVAAADLKKQET